MKVRDMLAKDWLPVSEIYAEGIATGFATFETEVPEYKLWDKAHLKSCRLIATDGKGIFGWAALSPVSTRRVYGGVAEISVYVGKDHRGKGAGKLLMAELIRKSEELGIWTLQSSIFPENKASIRLHQKFGFRYIGKRERVAKREGVWNDNLLFERRSEIVGND